MSIDDLRVIKNILSDEKFAQEIASNVDPRLFSSETKKLVDFIISYVKVYKSVPSQRVLEEKVKNPETLKEIKDIWEQALNTEVLPGEAKYDLTKLIKRFKDNKINEIKSELNDLQSDLYLKKIKAELEDLESITKIKNKSYIHKNLVDNITDFKNNYTYKSNNRDKEELFSGMKTGYSALDYYKGGLYPSELTLVGGASGSGKSIYLLNCAVNIFLNRNTIFTDPSTYNKGYNVLYFSLEMSYEACFNRLIAKLADVPTNSINSARLLDSELKSVGKTIEFLKNYPFRFDLVDYPRGLSTDEAEKVFLDICDKGKKPDLVVFDYMGIMQPNQHFGESDQDHLKLLQISESLHEFARTHQTHVMSAFQLNVMPPKTKDIGELVGVHRIGRSKAIINAADLGLMILSRPQEETYGDVSMHILKNRNNGLASFSLIKKLSHATILDQDPPFNMGNPINNGVEDLSSLLN